MNEASISDIRLGWLQRLQSVAQHQNIVRAAHECNIDPTALSDSIQRLEEALHRPLMAPATAHLTAFGRSFSARAEKVLELANLSSRSSTNVCVGWFQAVIAVAEHESYVKAANALGWKRYRVMRGVSELESWLGDRLIFSNGGLKLTIEGERILPAVREIVRLLENFADPDNDLKRDKTKRRTVPWWLRFKGRMSPTT